MPKPDIFQKHILEWFHLHGRHDLPWQQDKNPYRVWVSEIMLQQTQVTTVIPFFLRFMERFPTLKNLADATEDEVLHYWTGLGYYSRARNLYRTANIVMTEHEGQFPDTQELLEKLPGIGRSTAGAILAIAFEKKATILDGNVKRVLTRLFAITRWPGELKALEELWQIAETLTPEKCIADYTQAMMDLGATICIRSKPHCEKCPVKDFCVARIQGIERTLPHPKPRKQIPTRKTTLLLLQNGDSILLEKRPPTGVWGGLWSLPETIVDSSDAIKQFCFQRFHYEIKAMKALTPFRHTFSHFHLDILPILIPVKSIKSKIMEDNQQIWYNLRQPVRIGLPAPIKTLLDGLPI